ncbi:MAG: ferredoxin [Aquificaceae bacterium]|nr:ferredoxin [Aquificaceae bacterium]MCS7278127.1 ferredoxin [Aquificaceae bacterium]MDW8423091.1 ferredoxin [Aquificaceae bacterium]
MPQRFHNNGRGLNIKVDIDTCTACQLCYDRLPQVFVDRGDGIPLVILRTTVDEVYQELIKVSEDCPSGSIILSWTE